MPASSHNDMIEATQAYGIYDPSAEETEPPAQVHQISTVKSGVGTLKICGLVNKYLIFRSVYCFVNC